MNIPEKQYELVNGSREVVFQYCEQFSNKDYVREVEGFGWVSIIGYVPPDTDIIRFP